MNNQINENINKLSQEKIEINNIGIDSKRSITKVSIKKNRSINTFKKNVQDTNSIYSIKKPTKKLSYTKNILQHSLKTKVYNVNNLEKNQKQNEYEYSSFHKTKTHNEYYKKRENLNIGQNLFFGGAIRPTHNGDLNYEINMTNENDFINILKFANNLYYKDEHFKKNIVSKKNKSNNSLMLKNNLDLLGGIHNIYPKKKLIITFGEENNKKISHNISYNKIIPNKKKSNCNASSKDFKKNYNFSNFIKYKQKKNSPSKNSEEEINYNNLNNNNYYDLNDGEMTTKSCQQFYFNSKSHGKIKEKIETNSKSKIPVKLKMMNTKKSNNSKNNKTQIQDFDVITDVNQDNEKKKKKNFFCFLCCLNNKLDDSEED